MAQNHTNPVDQVGRFLTRLAAVITILVTLLPPIGFLVYARQEIVEGLEHHSIFQATAVTRFVTRNPDVWQDSRERLLESLISLTVPLQHTIVIDNAGRVIGEINPAIALEWPVLASESPFHEFGQPAGIVRTAASMAHILKMAFAILIVSGLLGLLVFIPMRRVPLAALTNSMRQLERGEERFRCLTEMSSDWYWEQDCAHRFTSVSSGAERSGLNGVAIVGRCLLDIGSSISQEERAEHSQLLESKQAFRNFEFALQTTAGEERWISVSGAPVFDEQGAFIGYAGTARDETLRRRAENILRNQKEVLHEMVVRKTTNLQEALETSQQLREMLEKANRKLEKLADASSSDLLASLQSLRADLCLLEEDKTSQISPESLKILQRTLEDVDSMSRLLNAMKSR
jgi:PAS domain S-box-containing protein